jgi:uncharacterized protein (TIGR03663 family)
MPPTRRRLTAFPVAFALIVAVALMVRLPHLARRPMHTDEAVHAVKLGRLLADGVYVYDPREFHGPTLYDFNLPILLAAGHDRLAAVPDAAWLRIVPVLFGVGLIGLLLLLRHAIPPRALLFAALLIAVSPAFVCYSRYYVQEILLVFFTLLFIAAVWRWWSGGRPAWLVPAGLALGLMIATKETWIILIAAMGGAAGLTAGWQRFRRIPSAIPSHPRLVWLLLIPAIAFVLAALILSNGFARPVAALDMFRAFGFYLERGLSGDGSAGAAAASIHRHPWWYYLRMLLFFRVAPGPFWSEAPLFIPALIGIGWILLRPVRGAASTGADDSSRHSALRAPHSALHDLPAPLLRFLAFDALLLLLIAGAIPYKTPWLILNPLLPLALVAGAGLDALLRVPVRPLRWLCGLLALAGCLHLAAQTRRSTGFFEADTRNPYVYAHTSTAYKRLVQRLHDLAAVAPAGRDLPVHVIVPGDDYWPLPWDLRDFTRVGYWSAIPPNPAAPVVISVPALQADLDAALGDAYLAELHGLRQEVLLLVYIRRDLWEAFMERRAEVTPNVPDTAPQTFR